MNCHSVGNILDLLVDGRLTEARAARVRVHLAACRACAARERALRPLPAEAVKVPEGLAAAVAAALRAPGSSSAPRPALRLSPAYGLAAAYLALLAAGPLIYGEPSQAGRAELGTELLR